MPPSSREVIKLTEISTVTDEAIQEIRFPFYLVTVESVNEIKANYRVVFASIEIVTPYDAGAQIQVGRLGDADLLIETSDVDAAVADVYAKEQDTDWGIAANEPRVTIIGAPTVGQGICVVRYTNPLS
jgi:hypothetical protein